MKHLNPPTLSPPRGYSHAVEVPAGRTIYVSGQIAVDPHGHLVGVGDFEAQARQVFENLAAALAAAGASLDDVAKITIFLTDIAQLPTLRAVRDRYFTRAPPASSLVEVRRLVLPELLVEIEAIAAPRASVSAA